MSIKVKEVLFRLKNVFNQKLLLIAVLEVALLLNATNLFFTFFGYFDFGSFIAAGKFANAGENPYSVDSPWIFELFVREGEEEILAPNLNPPIMIYLFQLFAKISPFLALNGWRVITIGLMVLSVILIDKEYPTNGFQRVTRIAWGLSLAGFWHIVQLGQIYGILILLTVLVWILLNRKQECLAGGLLGLIIAIKPNMMVWAVVLLLVNKKRTFFISGITSVVISLIPMITHGVEVYHQWLVCISEYSQDLLLLPANNTFQGFTVRLGSARAGLFISIIFLVFIVIYLLKTKPDIQKANSIGIISSLLVSPIAWVGYTILTLPIFFSQKYLGNTMKLFAGIFVVPFVIPLNLLLKNDFCFVFFGWFYGWGLVGLISWLFTKKSKQAFFK